jgi:WD40 repeat protein
MFSFSKIELFFKCLILINFNVLCCGESQNPDGSLIHVLNSNLLIQSFACWDDGYIATGSFGGFIKIWNVEFGILVKTFKSPKYFQVNALIVVQNAFIASGTYDGKIEIWNLNDGFLQNTVKISEYGVHSLAFLKNGTLACGVGDGVIILNPSKWELTEKLGNNRILSLVELKNGLLATGSSNSIEIWNTTTAEVVRTLDGHADVIKQLAILPNGLLVSVSTFSIKIWNPDDGVLLRTLIETKLTSLSLAVLKNGLLATSERSSVIKIWNSSNNFELKSFSTTGNIGLLTTASNGYLVGTSKNQDGEKINVWDPKLFNYNVQASFLTDSGIEFF